MTEYYIEREYAYAKHMDTTEKVDPYDNAFWFDSQLSDDDKEKVNLITSKVKGKNTHAPVIDLDVPCELVPSSQLGHYHLYIHKEISFSHFKNILSALVAAGIVEPGYADSAYKRGAALLRPIGNTKPGVQLKMSNILAQNAILKHQNYMLTKELEALKKQTTSLIAQPVDITAADLQLDTYLSELKNGLIEKYKTVNKHAAAFTADEFF